MPKEKESSSALLSAQGLSWLGEPHVKRMETWYRDVEEMQREALETVSHRAGCKVRNFTRAVLNVEESKAGIV